MSSAAPGRLQARRQSIDLLLQLGDSAVGLLLPLPGGLGDYALASSLRTPLARAIVVERVRLALDLQAAAGLASTGALRVVGSWGVPSPVGVRAGAGAMGMAAEGVAGGGGKMGAPCLVAAAEVAGVGVGVGVGIRRSSQRHHSRRGRPRRRSRLRRRQHLVLARGAGGGS